MCGHRFSAQTFPFMVSLRALLLGANEPCAHRPASAGTACVTGSKAAPLS
jgi:hypothetical protein